MIKDLVKTLSCDNQELQMHCASAIFKVAFFFFSSLHTVSHLGPLVMKKMNKNRIKGIKHLPNLAQTVEGVNIHFDCLFCSAVCRRQANP